MTDIESPSSELAPDASLERRNSRSPTSQQSRVYSPKNDQLSARGSNSPQSRSSKSPESFRSDSPSTRKSPISLGSARSRSPHSPQSHHSESNQSNSDHSQHKSFDRNQSQNDDVDSRSNSPNLQIDDKSSNRQYRSLSRSKSPSPPKSEDNENKTSKRSVASSDSENEEIGIKRKVVKMSESIDDESDEKSTKNVTADTLFGDANDISSDEENKLEEKEDDEKSYSSSVHGRSNSIHSEGEESVDRQREDDGKEEEQEIVPETRIYVEIPKIVTDLGKDIHFVKLPNFLSVETRPFDQETYEDEIDEEETMDEEGRQRIKLKVSNTIRWREYMNQKGDVVKESNARMVKWSDGSISLHLGNEIFDVYKQSLQGDHNHLFIRQGTGLQGQAVFRTKLTFRPHSTESFTHKKMTMSLADRSQKTSGIKILTQVGKDPTADRQYYLKKEEEKLRQAMRKQHQSRPKRSGRNSSGVLESHTGVNASYRDEGSDEENAISLNAIKNKYKKSDFKQGAAIYSSDEDDGSDFEARRRKKVDKVKAIKALRDSDEESEGSVRSREEGNEPDESNQNEVSRESEEGNEDSDV